MRSRTFGRLSWSVSEIGLGSWGMGGMWGPLDDAEAVRAIQRVVQHEVNFIDTALVYGNGHAEELIGQALATHRGRVYVASKVPPKNMEWPAREVPIEEAFPGAWIRECTEASLRRLHRDTLDLQQLHVWSPRWLGEQEAWLPTIEALKREGKIRAFGISINDFDPDSALGLVASGLIDSVQVIYNIFEQAPARQLFSRCQEHGVAVIVRVPFDEGSLTGRFTRGMTFHPEDWRGLYFQGDRLRETVDRVEQLQFLIRDEIETMAQAALKFCLSHPAVTTVIPGMRTRTHVDENCVVSDGKPLTAEELERLQSHAWSRNFYLKDEGVPIWVDVPGI